jgi:hypothetical protein
MASLAYKLPNTDQMSKSRAESPGTEIARINRVSYLLSGIYVNGTKISDNFFDQFFIRILSIL